MPKPEEFKYNKVKFDEPELEKAWHKVMLSRKKNKTKLKY